MIDGDEAMVGLMARHILQGQRPIFLNGLQYTGALQAYEAAALYQVLGMSRMALKLVPLAASLAFILTTYGLARRIVSTPAALIAALVAAAPPVYVAATMLKAWAPYPEVMALGNLLLALAIDLAWRPAKGTPGDQSPEDPAAGRGRALALGLLGGFALWLQGVAVYALATCALVLLARAPRKLPRLAPVLAAGLALGGIPLWLGNLASGFGTARSLAGGHPLAQDLVAEAGALLHDSLPRVLGLWQPWGATPAPVSWALGGVVGAGLLALLLRGRASHGRRLAPSDVPLVFALMLVLIYLGSGFAGPSLNPWGFDATGRYVLPLWGVVPLAVAALAEPLLGGPGRGPLRGPVVRGAPLRASLAASLVALVMLAHLAGYATSNPRQVFQSPYWNKLPFDSQPLLDALRRAGISAVWMNHWAGFPLMFDAQEAVIAADYYDVFVGGGINRFPEHFALVERADRPAYVLVTDEPVPALERRLQELGVMYRVERVGPYVIVQPLSRRVNPTEVQDAIDYRY